MAWTDGLESCKKLLEVLQQVISTGLDLLMPLKRVQINTRDAPWMTRTTKIVNCEKTRGLQGARNRFNPVHILQKRSESQEENVQSKIL